MHRSANLRLCAAHDGLPARWELRLEIGEEKVHLEQPFDSLGSRYRLGERMVLLVGKFGDRWSDLARAYFREITREFSE